jgi:AcrR family transcriptional regulator
VRQNKQVKEAIVREAAIIFSRYGFRKATLEDIASAIKKGKSTIYYYFGSKEEIFEAVLESEIAHLRKRLRLAISGSEDPKEKLKNYVVTRMLTIRELVNLYAALKDEYYNNIDFVERIRRKYDQEEIENFKEVLQLGVWRNFFQVYDINLAAEGVVMAMKGIEPRLFNANYAAEFDSSLANFINILLYGIVKR